MSSNSRLSIFLLLLAVISLLGLGLVMLASTSPWVEPEHLKYSHVKKQILFLFLGLVTAFAAGLVPVKLYEKYWWVFFAGACVLLTLCFIPGVKIEVNGSSRWIKFPLIGQFQPSEPSKIAATIALAMWMAKQQANPKHFIKGFVMPLLILALPAGLIFFEVDMGTTAVLVGSAFLVLFVGGARGSVLLGSAVAGVALLITYVNYAGGNRKQRLMAFQNIEAEKLDYALQQYRSLLAFGSGGVEGVGLGNGAEKHGYLPFAHTDFIFPIIGEELGLAATLGVILGFVCISAAGILIATKAESHFASLLAVGLTANIVIPGVMNIAVTTAMLPNTGLPLPFVSYGGSNLIFTMACVGMLVGIAWRSPDKDSLTVATKRKRKILRL